MNQTQTRIHLDQRPLMSPNPTTGEALYRLAGVPAHHELYREITGDVEDVAIPNAAETIQLAEDEHFHTGLRVITLIVNGKKRQTDKKRLTFDEVVRLAFDPVPTGPNVMFTVAYRNGPRQNPEGTMKEGSTVKVREGMKFDVTPTDKS